MPCDSDSCIHRGSKYRKQGRGDGGVGGGVCSRRCGHPRHPPPLEAPVAYLGTRQGGKATPPARTSRRKRGGGGPAPLLLLRLGMAADTPHVIR
ncbi:hypothetical protein BHE74_00022570 [Ensete ventricosum]|nr:hypothetical protein BHE74_00022570 [Ensete ventricosum]